MSLENKGRIRILRGNASDENVKTVSLYDGQPFYDANSKHLYIGNGKTINESSPIIADANNIIFYCETAGDVSKKEINLPGYKLINGQRSFIQFANDFTTVDNTLSINGSDEKEIIFNGKTFVYNDITDLTGYTVDWYNGDGKSIVSFQVEQEQPLIFKSNGQWFRGIKSPENEEIQYITNSGTVISVSSNNKSEIQPNYRYMEIIGGDYATNTQFIGLLKQYKKPIYLTNSIKKDIVYELYCGEKIYINSLNSKYSTYATYASEDISKGTIEERLTNLGFKQGAITVYGDSAQNQSFVDKAGMELEVGTQVGTITRQGNYCIINCKNLYLNSKAESKFTTYLKIDDYNKYFKGAPDVGGTGVYAFYASGKELTTRVGYANVVSERIQLIITDTTNLLAAGSNPTLFNLNFGYEIRDDSK